MAAGSSTGRSGRVGGGVGASACSVVCRAGLQATIDWFTNPENLRKYKADIYNV